MNNTNDFYADSFRALNAKKLGLSVMELCVDDTYEPFDGGSGSDECEIESERK